MLFKQTHHTLAYGTNSELDSAIYFEQYQKKDWGLISSPN